MGVAVALAVACGQASGQQDTVVLDRLFVRETVESLSEVVAREYFDAEVAARIASSLTEGLADGRYYEASTLQLLAELLTRDLVASSTDRHLGVTVVRDRAVRVAAGNPEDDREVRARRTNFGVQRVELLDGNVGYLNLRYFWRPEEARDTISAAMRTLRSADALIVDMRENRGGSPGTVALLASYLFDSADLPLFQIVPRYGSASDWYRTAAPPMPERNGTRPVYVLTSERTFSAGEGLAYLLQERGRGEVIGEQTPGAANPGRAYRVNALLEVTVPNSYVRTAVKGDNWEGVGVLPDVAVPAGDALRAAHIRALRELITREPSGSWQETLKRELNVLQQRKKH